MVNPAYWIFSAPLTGLGGLLVAALLYGAISNSPSGNERMRDFSDAVGRGGTTFLKTECWATGVLAAGVSCFLAWMLSAPAGLAFLAGAGCTELSRIIGVGAAGRAHSRAVEAARVTGAGMASRMALWGGAVSGLAAASLAVIGQGSILGILRGPAAVPTLAAFALGCCFVALIARTAGGIFTQAADRAAKVFRTVEPGDPGDARHPTVIAKSVGQCLGGLEASAGLLCSFASAVAASVAVSAASGAVAEPQRVPAMAYPLLLASSGLLAAVVGVFAASGRRSGEAALRSASLLSAAVFAVGAYGASRALGLSLRAFLCAGLGLVAALLAEFAAAYYTTSRPSRRIAEASFAGPTANLVAGLAVGMEACGVPALLIAAAVLGANYLAGAYGLGLAALGMVATSAASASAASAAAGNVNSIALAKGTGLGPDVLAIMDALRLQGRRSAAGARGSATLSSAAAALALFAAFGAVTNHETLELTDGATVTGLLLGAAIPFIVGALALHAVGASVFEMISQVRREIREQRGLGEDPGLPGIETSVSTAARASLRHAAGPGLTALVTPLLAGYFLGAQALAGLLVGSTASGFFLTSFLFHAGGAWTGAQDRIETGVMGGKQSSSHAAATVGADAGDLLAGAAAPVIGVAVAFLAILCLAIAPSLH